MTSKIKKMLKIPANAVHARQKLKMEISGLHVTGVKSGFTRIAWT